MHSSFHHVQQKFSRRARPGPYRSCWNAEHRAHIASVHLFNQRELQNVAQFFRQAFNFSPQAVQHHPLLGVLRSVNHRACFRDVPGGVSRQPPPVASQAVQRQPEHDPVYPSAEFFRFPERRKLLVGAQECFLRYIFRVGRIAQDAVRNQKSAPLIRSDAIAKSPLSGLCASALAINALTHAPVTPLLPFTYRHRAGATRSKNSTHGGRGWWAIRTTRKTLAPDGGHRRPHPAACRAFPIRRERWVGMPAESVATGLQSAHLEVSATAQCRGSPSSGQENSAVAGPSAAARHESESRLLRPARGSHRNSADYQAAGSGLALFGGGAQVLPGAPEAVDPARSPGRAAIGESQPQPARATFLARSPERLASAVVAAFSRCLASTGRVLSSAAWI